MTSSNGKFSGEVHEHPRGDLALITSATGQGIIVVTRDEVLELAALLTELAGKMGVGIGEGKDGVK